MERLSEIYDVYTLYKLLNQPYNETLLFEHGIINDRGHVLLTTDTMTPLQEKLWSPFNQVVHKIKEAIATSPLPNKMMQQYTAAIFLCNESQRVKTLSKLSPDSLLITFMGPRSHNYVKWASSICESRFMDEDMALPTTSAGGGNIAGIGVGPQGEPGKLPKKFAGCQVFEVNSSTFQKCLHGKLRHEHYKKYVGNDQIGEEIRQYGRKNPKKGIILMDAVTGSMLYLKRPQI